MHNSNMEDPVSTTINQKQYKQLESIAEEAALSSPVEAINPSKITFKFQQQKVRHTIGHHPPAPNIIKNQTKINDLERSVESYRGLKDKCLLSTNLYTGFRCYSKNKKQILIG